MKHKIKGIIYEPYKMTVTIHSDFAPVYSLTSKNPLYYLDALPSYIQGEMAFDGHVNDFEIGNKQDVRIRAGNTYGFFKGLFPIAITKDLFAGQQKTYIHYKAESFTREFF